MEEVLIHEADLGNGKEGEADVKKVEVTDQKRLIIRTGTCIFILAVIICVFIILVKFK